MPESPLDSFAIYLLFKAYYDNYGKQYGERYEKDFFGYLVTKRRNEYEMSVLRLRGQQGRGFTPDR